MEPKLTRRRFGRLAIASTAVAGLGYLANKTFAQTRSPLVVYGVRPSREGGKLTLQSLNVESGTVQDVTTATLDDGEKVIGLTSLANGALVLAVGPVRAGKKENAPTRLIFLGKSPRTLTLSGLGSQYALESFLGLNDGSLVGLVNRKNNMPPVRVVDINVSTGNISFTDRVNLPAQERFSQLMETPNGTLYTTLVKKLGNTTLVRLDLAQGRVIDLAQLNFNGRVWNSGLNDMVSSPTSPMGKLFALGAPRYASFYNLYNVDADTGAMTLLRERWGVTKITTLRA